MDWYSFPQVYTDMNQNVSLIVFRSYKSKVLSYSLNLILYWVLITMKYNNIQ